MFFLKQYIKLHIKFWYLYVISVLMIMLGFYISLWVGHSVAYTETLEVTRIVSMITFTVISSSLMWISNVSLVKKINNGFKITTIPFLLCVQFVSTVPFFLIGYILFDGK